jgi:hypothetical protein
VEEGVKQVEGALAVLDRLLTRNHLFRATFPHGIFLETTMGREILLWLLGVPIPVILLLWLFFGR